MFKNRNQIIKVKLKNLDKTKCVDAIPVSDTLRIFFIVIQAVISLEFGFIIYKSSRQKILMKFFSVILSSVIGIAIIILNLGHTSGAEGIWYTKYIIENYCYVLILIFVPTPKTFYQFLRHLNRIDFQMNVDNSSYHVEAKLIVCCIISIIYKVLISVVYCTQYEDCLKTVIAQILFTIPLLSLDIPLIVLYFIFYMTHIRLVAIKKLLKEKTITINDAQYFYKKLIDTTENIKKSFDAIFIVTLSINIPGLMAEIYDVIQEIKVQSKSPLSYLAEIISAITLSIVFFAPAISASTLSTEAKEIKLILHDNLFKERDLIRQKEIQRFINYIDARNYNFTVLRIIKLDATLPVSSLNLFITYLIVLLQVTHLY